MITNKVNMWAFVGASLATLLSATSSQARIVNCPIPPSGKIPVAAALANPIFQKDVSLPSGPAASKTQLVWTALKPEPLMGESWHEWFTESEIDEVEIKFQGIDNISKKDVCLYHIDEYKKGEKDRLGSTLKVGLVWLALGPTSIMNRTLCPATADGKGFKCPDRYLTTRRI